MLEITETFWFPVILLISSLIILRGFLLKSNRKSYNLVVGIVFGAYLGFVSNVFFNRLQYYDAKVKTRAVLNNLLKIDAQLIYGRIVLYETVIMNKKEKYILDKFKMFYWDKLKNDPNCLAQASDPQIAIMFMCFNEFDNINNEIDNFNKGKKDSFQIVRHSLNRVVYTKSHLELLKLFYSIKEIENIDNNTWKICQDIKQSKHNFLDLGKYTE